MKIIRPLACFFAATSLLCCNGTLSPQQLAAVQAGADIANLAINSYAERGKVSLANATLAHAVVGIGTKAATGGSVQAVVIVPTAPVSGK